MKAHSVERIAGRTFQYDDTETKHLLLQLTVVPVENVTAEALDIEN